jgi:hypothetical protein
MTDLTRLEIQHISDLRIIALCLRRGCEGNPRKVGMASAMRRIAKECEALIAEGPAEFRHIIEDVTPIAALQHELRASVFGHARDF